MYGLDKLGDTLMPRSHLEHSVSLKDLLASCQEEQFKLTPQIITNAMIDHRFKAFIKPYDCLTICETLGEGERLHVDVAMLSMCQPSTCYYTCTATILLSR